ncbi:MAG: hypothetical protein LBR60_03450 [Fibrobacter sp.]|jgi:hypothetical protein|nr:hypothetical protein [Fibrobacter sp.]
MKKLYLLFILLALWGCKSDVVIHYQLPQPVVLDLYAESYYSTIDLEGVERVGTIAASYVELEYASKGDTLQMTRRFEIDKSRGYLKNSLPLELSWRIPEVTVKALGQRVLTAEGFENYDSTVAQIPMPERWRNQLTGENYDRYLIRAEKHRWEMDHLLSDTVPEKGNVTELVRSRGRLNFALIQIDSVVTDGFHNLDSRRCLGYTVYLTENESFPYFIWEQHVNSKIGTEQFVPYSTGHKGEYQTAYWVAFDPATGIPCQEREVKKGVHTMVNPSTGDTAVFESLITLERLYTVKK